MGVSDKMNYRILVSLSLLLILATTLSTGRKADAKDDQAKWAKHIQLVLDETKPLKFERNNRLPLYLWPAMNPGKLNDQQAEELVQLLDQRGVGLVCSWNHKRTKDNLSECLPVARAQKKLGLRVNVNANTLLYSFFDGSQETAHIDSDGVPFFDDTFGKKKMGCPFRLEHRIPAIKDRFTPFLNAYKKEQTPIDFMFADWEIDGPLEWNRAHQASKRCRICCENIPQIDNFLSYQHELRLIRSRMQRLAYAEPVLDMFPKALVGNYAVYPHDGWRYWYDYFEHSVEGQPVLTDQKAGYRHWANDFETTGYTFSMPVVYPWSWTWNWYDFEPGDYRWFYNGLLVASNAGKHTPADVPIISFVHWHTVDVGLSEAYNKPTQGLTKPQQMSEWAYQELLWHMLLRGTDTFFLWCAQKEQAKEVSLLHPVWSAAQEYGEFLDNGVPVNFNVPKKPGCVISGLRLKDKVLIRRTDFTGNSSIEKITISGKSISVPASKGKCQILSIND